MSFVIQIDYYAEGARVLTLAPGLAILCTDRSRQPLNSTELEERCGKCRASARLAA